MWTKHPIIVAQLAFVDKSLCHITVWCKLAAIKFCFSTSLPGGARRARKFAKETSPQFKALHSRVKSCFLSSVLPPPLQWGCGWCPQHSPVMGGGGGSWWRSTMPWPAVSSVYEKCHHGWQPSRSMIYTLPIATGTCREVTTRPRRSVGLFQARGCPRCQQT